MDNGNFKYCINCGAKLNIDAQFCNKCGAKQPTNNNNINNANQVNQQNSYNTQRSQPNNYTTSQNQAPYNGSENPGFISSFVYWFKNSFKPNQCMGRADFWWGTLGAMIVLNIITAILRGIMTSSSSNYYGPTGAYYFTLFIYVVISIIFSIMEIVTCVQRLHDTGHSGFNWLWSLTIIGYFYVLFLIIQPTNWNEKRWPRPYNN